MTTNNNQSMATSVETFYVEETINLIHDNDALAKWNEKVAELGLEGQQEVLVNKDKSPIPFLWMNAGIIATFETLCPTKVEIEKYNKTPIPVELLDAVSLCKAEGYFDAIDVWYNEQEKDPVIVGYVFDKSKNDDTRWMKLWYSKKYLIGRWADVKASLDTLTQRAMQIFKRNEELNIKQRIKDAQRRLEDLDTAVMQKFGSAMPSTDLPF
jgi:hypothetical protein